MKKMLALALVLAAAPLAASTAPLSYTFVEGGYNKAHTDYSGSGAEASGGYLKGSYDIGSGINAIGSYRNVKDSNTLYLGGTGYHYTERLTQAELGLGYHQAMTERVDFLAELAWVRQTDKANVTTLGRFSDSATGGRAAVGVRGQFNEYVEGSIKANYYDGGDFNGVWTGTAGVQVKFNPTWGVTAEVEHGDIFTSASTTLYTVGVRASF